MNQTLPAMTIDTCAEVGIQAAPGQVTDAAAPFLSVVFPVYNEEGAVRGVLEEAEAALRDSGFRYEIVACDDGSRDGTKAILLEMAARIPAMHLLVHERNQGIQATIEDVYTSARGKWMFLNGSDGQWKTAEVLRMLPLASDPRTIVIGRRKDKHYSWWRSFVSAMYNLLPRVLFGVRTYDAGSIKLMPRSIMEEITPRSAGVFREGERLIRAARAGYRIVVIDVDCAPRRTGTAGGARFVLVAGAARDLLKCWWQLVVCRDR